MDILLNIAETIKLTYDVIKAHAGAFPVVMINRHFEYRPA